MELGFCIGLMIVAVWKVGKMGIHVIPGSGSGPAEVVSQAEQDRADKITRCVQRATELAGPIPILPAFLAERGYPSSHVDPKTGFIVQDGPDPGIFGDPNAASIAADYQAQLTAWQQRYTALFQAEMGTVERVCAE